MLDFSTHLRTRCGQVWQAQCVVTMGKSTTYNRDAWSDRFNQPAAQTLEASLQAAPAKLFAEARRWLKEIEGVSEVTCWYGDCWKWVLEYRVADASTLLAVLVPSPTDLQLAIPVDPDFLRAISTRRLKRAVRDGLDLAAEPFDTKWGVWSLQSASLVGDLQDLLLQKLAHLSRKAG